MAKVNAPAALTTGALILPTLVALSMPLAANAAIWFASSQPQRFFAEPAILLFNMSWAAAPLLLWAVLAAAGVGLVGRYWPAVLVGLGLTALCWGWVAWEGYRYQTTAAAAGANIGLGLVLLAAPVIIFALMWVTSVINQVGDR